MKGSRMLAGIYPATLTMFDARGRVDLGLTREHVDRLVSDGAHGIVATGTSGEFIALSDKERLQVIASVVRAVNGRVPVLASTGAYSTAHTIALTTAAADAGADAALVILPYYQRPSRAEIMWHFEEVAKATSIPLLVYNNPANSAAPALSADDLGALYREGLASGVKSTFPSVHQVHEALASTDDGFRVFYGSFMAPLEALAGGAHGWISGLLNVTVKPAVTLWTAVQDSDLAAARSAWSAILPIRDLYTKRVFGEFSDLALYRAILRAQGFDTGRCRPPMLDLPPDAIPRLQRFLAQ
jgi:4-hydroxy-tetrahydrodipicolinate synthase